MPTIAPGYLMTAHALPEPCVWEMLTPGNALYDFMELHHFIQDWSPIVDPAGLASLANVRGEADRSEAALLYAGLAEALGQARDLMHQRPVGQRFALLVLAKRELVRRLCALEAAHPSAQCIRRWRRPGAFSG